MADPSEPRRRFRPSLTLSLAGSFGLLMLVSLVAVIAVQWTISRKNTFELFDGVAGLFLEYMELAIQRSFDPAVDQVEMIARDIESGAFSFDDPDTLGVLLRGAMAGTPQLSSINVFDRQLRIIRVRRTPERLDEIYRGVRAGDTDVERIAAQTRAVQGAFWGEAIHRDGRTLLTLQRPLWRDGEWLGFIAAVVTVERLSEMATRLSDHFQATAFILSGPDHVLAHPNLVHPHPEKSPATPLARLERVGDPVLAEIWDGEPVLEIEREESPAHVVRLSLAGEEYMFVYRSIPGYGDASWTFGAWFLYGQVSQALERLKAAVVISAALVVVCLVSAFMLGRLIARPIRRVADGASRVGKLDLARVERLPASVFRELDDQSRAFNTMLASLRSFETYVPRSLVTTLIRRGEDQVVTSEERELTVMFTDVVGFTAMSEALSAEEVARFLNDHLALLGTCVEAEAGTVDKFIGDALMAFWGAPERQPDTALRACRAALAMRRAVAADNARRREAGQPPVRVRIGVHSGPVVVGNIGWPGRMNYTIVGDTVNAGQRLEALGKELDRGEEVTILVSGDTAAQLGDAFAFEPAGTHAVKGKTAGLEVLRLLDGRGLAEA